MKRRVVLWVLMVAWMSGAVHASTDEGAFSGVIRSAQRAVVEVLVDGQMKGGGAFVSEDGLLITASHLFTQPDARFAVVTASDERLDAELVAIDKGHDMVLLRVPSLKGKGQAFLPVSDAIPAVGSRIFNLGNALNVRDTVMFGRVSVADAVFSEWSDSNGYVENFLVASMTPSLTSGGVWVDLQGRIVGVQNGRLNDGKIASGVAVVAPPQAISKLLATRKTASTPDIGGWVWECWTADKGYLASIPDGTEGLVITWLRKDGAMKKAGLKRLDTIVACGGEPVRRRQGLLRRVRACAPGEELLFTILEQNQRETKEVAVKLECLEKIWLEKARQKKEKAEQKKGKKDAE